MKILLYGAGSYAYWVVSEFRKLPDYQIVGMVDSNPGKWGKSIYGFCVESPERIFKRDYDRIFISSTLAGREIYQYLTERLGVTVEQILNQILTDTSDIPPPSKGFPQRISGVYYISEPQALQREFEKSHERQSRDPFSEEYLQYEFDFFKFIADSEYDVNREGIVVNNNDEKKHLKNWFAEHEDAFIENETCFIDRIQLPRNANILELGCAEGILVEYLSKRTGSAGRITGVDISSACVEFGNRRLEQRGITNAKLVCAPYETFVSGDDKFDIIIFHRSFHHIPRHIELLKRLYDISSNDACLYLIMEVITHKYYKPWGLNTNFDALSTIKSHKWLELIFESDYLREAFKKSGWALHFNDDLTLDFLTATKLLQRSGKP
jgi:cyclopropane fatty-acyl-phospholipid synthase-like methyltransferase